MTDAATLLAAVPLPAAPHTAPLVPVGHDGPLQVSLEVKISDAAWHLHGARAFVEEVVPWAVNNSGWAPNAAADLFLAHCAEVTGDGALSVLEIGAGTGLFAVQFLNRVLARCRDEGRDEYTRLTYHLTDISESIVDGWRTADPPLPHPDRLRFAAIDARAPHVAGLNAVFSNYALDPLPSAVVRMSEGRVEQLFVQAWRPQGHGEVDLTSPASLRAAHQDLTLTTRFDTDGADGLPHLDVQALDEAPVQLNYVAFNVVDACLAALAPHGFMLVNDYGPATEDEAEDWAPLQRFGLAAFFHLNFPALERHVQASGHQIFEPPYDDQRGLHTRLLLRGDAPDTVDTFDAVFGDLDYANADRRVAAARAHITEGDLSAAQQSLLDGLEYCPEDWHLLGEAARFVLERLAHPAEALALADLALTHNPWYSANLWSTRGAALYQLDQPEAAFEAFTRAMAIDPHDPESRYNLALIHHQRGEAEAALGHIATGLAHDDARHLRDALLALQGQVLGQLDTLYARTRSAISARDEALRHPV